MATPALHHVGLQVSDIDRAGAFYCEALGGRWLSRPITFEGPGAEQAMGLEGVRLRLGIVGFEAGSVELFEFLGDVAPEWARLPREARLPHLALHVEDTDATLARVEAAGGRRVWPAVDRFGPARVIYVSDPDGNIVELLDRPPSDIAGALIRWFPDAAPDRS
jgi:catechol 2,3-dioxygenase-like lactoylglutathione lyase family enzyme